MLGFDWLSAFEVSCGKATPIAGAVFMLCPCYAQAICKHPLDAKTPFEYQKFILRKGGWITKELQGL